LDHERRFGSDAISLFIKIHSCIAARVSGSANSPDILFLNHHFIRHALSVYEAFEEGDMSPQRLSPAWVWVYDLYSDDPKAAGTLLPLMAAVHILEDLEAAVYESPVARDEYEGVFDHIVKCLDAETAAYEYPTLRQEFIHQLQDRIANRARDAGIWRLRELAWQSAERRRRLKPLAAVSR